ncbi:TPA: family 1 glycosylhydrolase, partial [Clostridioides difficile]|nr:family 1 glycosylhydrolase [Clostridioides difficile]
SSSQGFNKRYGLVYINRTDHEVLDLKRIKKDSFYWYKEVIENNGIVK